MACSHFRSSELAPALCVLLPALAAPRLASARTSRMPEVPKAFKADVQSTIDADMPIVSKVKKILSKLQNEQLVNKIVVRCEEVLIHPKNRSGLLVNAFDSHRTLVTVLTIGGDRDQLTYSYAFQRPQKTSQYDKYVDTNRKLVAASGGMLAEVTGKERYFSVGGGHWVSAMKAAKASCSTTVAGLGDSNGRINLARCRQDEEIKAMMDEGWSWNILDAVCEETWPELPDLFQRALNSFNQAWVGRGLVKERRTAPFGLWGGVGGRGGQRV